MRSSLLFFLSFSACILLQAVQLCAQNCDSKGNVLLFSNYDGGFLRILIDEDIPNLKIGVATYEPTRISIFGPYAANVTEVHYAGLNPSGGTGNFHCDPSLAVTTVDPLPNPNAKITFAQVPPVTIVATDYDSIFPGYADLIGYNGGILGCTTCSLTKGTGGVNNYVQVLDYFTTYFNGSARFIKTRYGCWCDTLDCSLPINCCQELNNGSSQALVLTASKDTICNNQTVTITASTGYDIYTWSTGAKTSSIQVNTAGTYTVTAQNECGSYSASITIASCPTEDCKNGKDDDGDGLIDLNDPDCACDTNNLKKAEILLFSGGVCDTFITLRFKFVASFESIQWYRNNIALPNANGISLIIDNQAANSGDYTVLLTYADGTCSVSAAQSVVFNTPPQYQAMVTPANCFGEATGMVDLNFTNNIPLLSIEWFDAAGQLLGDQALVKQLPAGKYALKIRYGAQCVLSDTFIIVQPLELLLKAEVSNATCNTNGLGKILLGIEGGTTPYQITVNNGTPGLAATFELPAGKYKIKVADAEGCEKKLDSLTILPAPTFSLSVEGPTDLLEPGDTFSLKAISSYPLDQLIFSWIPDGTLQCNNCPVTQGIAFQNTKFALSAIDSLGCTATAFWEIKVDQKIAFYVPNAIFINDSGTNDQFQIFPGKGVDRVLSLQIFDRWGNLVHDSVDPWDGRSNNKVCQAGVYTWFAQIKPFNGGIKRETGSVTLIR